MKEFKLIIAPHKIYYSAVGYANELADAQVFADNYSNAESWEVETYMSPGERENRIVGLIAGEKARTKAVRAAHGIACEGYGD